MLYYIILSCLIASNPAGDFFERAAHHSSDHARLGRKQPHSCSRLLSVGEIKGGRFFYGHKQNRFWPVLAAVFDRPVPKTVEEKKQLLLKNNVALWDVIASCSITGSADSSIKNVVPNDVLPIIKNSKITAVFVNGNAAARLYEKYLFPATKIKATVLPSTSPANARFTFDLLLEKWKAVKTVK